ncbi:MAG: toxin [Candidatus Roizmanbacteria bacterium]|nr:toxin [Candidatus Roizmanbacteria bacterium]
MLKTEFNEEKNAFLKLTRGINFEDILSAIDKGGLLDDIQNPSKNHPNQRAFLVKIKNYVYFVPYVQDKKGLIFLKTLYPSRLFTKSYLKKYDKKNYKK